MTDICLTDRDEHSYMSTKRTYFITGGQGKLGSFITPFLNAVSPAHSEVDIQNYEQLFAAVKSANSEAIIHLAAVSDQKKASVHIHESYATNVVGTRNVSRVASELGLKLFYISSDYVFRGTSGGYTEEDVPDPANWYGFTKAAGEIEISRVVKEYCIIRTSFRPKIWPFETAFTNVFTSADYIDVIGSEILLAFTYDISGIIHIGTPKKTFFELASKRNPSVRPEENTDPLFPKNRYLDCTKWENVKKQMKNIE